MITKPKKLVLQRRAIRDLTASELGAVRGGNGGTFLTQSSCAGQSDGCTTVNTTMDGCGSNGSSDQGCGVTKTTYGVGCNGV